MMSFVEIGVLLILVYTAYLIITEGGNKDKSSSSSNDTNVSSTSENNKTTNDVVEPERSEKKSAPVQKIEGDTDVLRQGKNYSEQQSADVGIPYQRSSKYESQADMQVEEITQPSTKNQSSTGSEMVSVVCPYCDNKVLVPKGGCAECSCCSSILNDDGGIMEE